MAEAIEINFPTESDKNPKIDSDLKNQILGFNVKDSMDSDKDSESCPEEYTIDNYYKEVFRRIYINHNKDLSSVTIPPIIGYANFVDIKISIGLLLPSERLQLENFLKHAITPPSWTDETLGDMWPPLTH